MHGADGMRQSADRVGTGSGKQAARTGNECDQWLFRARYDVGVVKQWVQGKLLRRQLYRASREIIFSLRIPSRKSAAAGIRI